MSFSFTPGCCCATGTPNPCIFFQDSFGRADDTDLGADWTEVSGDAEVSGGALLIVDNGSMIIADDPSPTANHRFAGTVSIPTGKVARVFLGWLNSSDYLRVTFSLTGGTLAIFSGGVAIRLETFTYGSALTASTDYAFEVCLKDSKFVAKINGNEGVMHFVSAPGLQVGVGATLAPVTFDNLIGTEVSEDCDDCTYTPVTVECPCCITGNIVNRVGIEIAGVVNGAAEPCDDCTTLNGLWLPTHAIGYDGCEWTWLSVFDDPAPPPFCGDLSYEWYFYSCAQVVDDRRYAVFEIYSGGVAIPANLVARWSADIGAAADLVDCDSLDGTVLTLETVGPAGTGSCDDFAGSTVTIRLDP